MTILAGRAHTCVHPKVSITRGSKDDACRNITTKMKMGDKNRCTYFSNTKKQTSYENYGLREVWDIEELVTSLKQKEMCPYYGARDLMEVVDIVFCPYNYLIDPKIRSNMSINIDNQIVIIDEAHNIEDTCRESTNTLITKLELDISIDQLKKLIAKFDQGLGIENASELSQSSSYFLDIVRMLLFLSKILKK